MVAVTGSNVLDQRRSWCSGAGCYWPSDVAQSCAIDHQRVAGRGWMRWIDLELCVVGFDHHDYSNTGSTPVLREDRWLRRGENHHLRYRVSQILLHDQLLR